MGNKRVVVIGGSIDGIKAAVKAVREDPEIDAKILTSAEYLPLKDYQLSYFIENIDEDIESFMDRTMECLKTRYHISVFTRHQVTEILPLEKKVMVQNLREGRESRLEYDKLVIATGMKPAIPSLDGIHLKNVFFLDTLEDVFAIRQIIKEEQRKKAVVVGGKSLGVDVANSLWAQGIQVTLVEIGSQIIPEFDMEIAELSKRHMEQKGLGVLVEEKVLSLIGNARGEVVEVHTPNRILPTDLVIWLDEREPNVNLAKNAGIAIGKTGAIELDEYMETNIPGIYAVGGCIQSTHQIMRNPAWINTEPANDRIAQIIGNNIAYGNRYTLGQGVLGTTSIRAFGLNISKTGLSSAQAKEEEYDIETVLLPVYDTLHGYTGNYRDNIIKLIVDKISHKVLGAQCIGGSMADKLVDIVATLISMGGKIEDLKKLDLTYPLPPFIGIAPAVLAADVALNKLEGKMEGIFGIHCPPHTTLMYFGQTVSIEL
jgi:NADPH-dependent 2,4-dienoyl-CoA reductase/sulfur reductase-like enzyme